MGKYRKYPGKTDNISLISKVAHVKVRCRNCYIVI